MIPDYLSTQPFFSAFVPASFLVQNLTGLRWQHAIAPSPEPLDFSCKACAIILTLEIHEDFQALESLDVFTMTNVITPLH